MSRLTSAESKSQASSAHEIGILMDVAAPNQEKANTIIGIAKSLLLHTDFEGRKCNAGNIEFPFSPTDIQVGEVFRFTMSHTLWLDNPTKPFPTEWAEIWEAALWQNYQNRRG